MDRIQTETVPLISEDTDSDNDGIPDSVEGDSTWRSLIRTETVPLIS